MANGLKMFEKCLKQTWSQSFVPWENIYKLIENG